MSHKHEPCEDCDCDHEHSENEQQHFFENLDDNTKREIQELQLLEQSFQQLLMQKQAFQMELDETENSILEVKKAEGEVFKIVGSQVIIKTTKEQIEKDMSHKKELLELRLTSMEKQEKSFSEKIESLRETLISRLNKK